MQKNERDARFGYAIPQKVIAQQNYCIEHQLPFLAPRRHCTACGRYIWDSISNEEAGSTHITGCPVCHVSYCE